jgi:excinuclease ABC subunit C
VDLKELVNALPRRPGVYRMFAADGELLYVGKARHLKDRVGSYFTPSRVDPRIHSLVTQIRNIEVTVTASEIEALLLEYNLIKEHRPRFNVTLRDGKSFPYIHLHSEHPSPRLSFYRGARGNSGRYFGPYPNAGAVKEVLHELQKMFRIRNCRDSFFANRSRPCLQHQIGRCSAPCVELITAQDYAADVAAAVKLLDGDDRQLVGQLQAQMEQAAQQLQYERAARLRDQLAALQKLQSEQVVTTENERDVDIFALAGDPAQCVICVMPIRGGRSLGTRNFFPRATLAELPEVLVSFVMQYYATAPAPAEIYLDRVVDDLTVLNEALQSQNPHRVRVHIPTRGLGARWVEWAQKNATEALRMRRSQKQSMTDMLQALATELQLKAVPQRIECFDISHTSGEGTVASCVVFDADGPAKKEYRRFNISNITPGDDYAALSQALKRRYTRVSSGELPAADLLLIDGGLGQLNQVAAALTELGFSSLQLIGVAKGPDRKPGQERLFTLTSAQPYLLAPHSPALHLIQRIRDEAHRFAITGHRRRRARRHQDSILETVPGLGPSRRRALLLHFGGLQGVLQAGTADFEKVAGIGSALAQSLYDHLHPGS